jgi:uncharacterized protein (DUF1800 family)
MPWATVISLMAIDTVIATNRFGLGARPGELDQAAGDPKGWLAQQTKGTRPVPAEVAALPTSAAVFRVYEQSRQQQQETKRDAATASDEEVKKKFMAVRKAVAPIYLDQVAARYATAVKSNESFRERLVHFWTNHFAVSADKPQVAALAATLENEAIRPNLAGSFCDLLLAVESHPAMILYLDNQASIGGNSQAAKRFERRAAANGRKVGINENLAREILELHTLGVNGGYTQADVTSFARVLTGWSIGSDRGPIAAGEVGKFTFRENAHEPGAQTILGKRYAESGEGQARAVLQDLAKHQATATHIATKLVRHFVGDDPPPDAVDRVAKVFRDTSGKLSEVHQSLIDLAPAWRPDFIKYKTPHEFVVSTLRSVDVVPAKPQQVFASFQLLGQRPFTPGSPAGWPDTAAQWDGPDALLKRIEWATQFGERVGAKVKPLEVAAASLGQSLSERTRVAISRAASAAQGVTLLLASPEFMRR